MTGTAITVRDARGSDLADIVALDALHSGASKGGYWRRIMKRYGEGPAAERVALVAADAGDRLVGFLFGEVRAWEFDSERCGWIFAVAVSPEHERAGLATRLCREAIERFGHMGVEIVRTMVRRENVPLLALFRSLGFVAGPFNELERAVSSQSSQQEGAA